MKRLFLIRHAKSSWKDTNLIDFDRPLNGRGKKDAPEMGKRLKLKDLYPDMMLSSPARRAADTALAMAKVLDYPKSNINFDKRLYHAGEEAWLKVLAETEDEFSTLFVFGHNPGLTDFANRISSIYVENLVTSGVFALRLKINSWKQIAQVEQAEVLFYDFPKNNS